MIKIISILCVLLISSLSNTFAQTKTVEFYNQTETTRTLSYGNFDVTFSLENAYGNGKKLSIHIKNNSAENTIMLIKDDYSKHDLKREHKIKYSKDYSGINGSLRTPGCNHLKTSGPIFIGPGVNRLIIQEGVDASEANQIEISLPVYYVQHKFRWSKKWRIHLDQQDIKFNIDLDVEFDEKYTEFEKRCQALIEEYNTTEFCTNKAHTPSFTKQKEEFEQKRDNLAKEISGYYGNRYLPFDAYKNDDKYSSLVKSIRGLDVYNQAKDCGKHQHQVVATKKTVVPTVDLASIANELNDIYLRIYNSDDWGAEKAKVIKDVERLYKKAATHKNWENSKEHDRIVSLYNIIKTQ